MTPRAGGWECGDFNRLWVTKPVFIALRLGKLGLGNQKFDKKNKKIDNPFK